MEIVAFVNQTSSKPPAAKYQLAKVRSHVSRTVWRRNRIQSVREHQKRKGEESEFVRAGEDASKHQRRDEALHVQKGAPLQEPLLAIPAGQSASRSTSASGTTTDSHASITSLISRGSRERQSGFSLSGQQHGPRSLSPQPRRYQPPAPDHRLPGENFRSDPFHSLPSRENQTMMRAFDYFTRVVSSEFAPLANIPGVANFINEILVPLAIQTPYYYYSLLTASLIARAIATNTPLQNEPNIMYAHGKTLRGLKAALINFNDDAVPLTLVQILTTEWQLGNRDARVAHSSGLARVLEVRGVRPKSPTTQVLDLLVTLSRTSSIFQPSAAVHTGPPKTKDPAQCSWDRLAPLTYPKNHSTASFIQSAPLPSGYTQLINGSQQICFQIIHVLSTVASTMAASTKGLPSPSVEWQTLVNRLLYRFTASNLQPIEQPLYYGLVAFCYQQQQFWTRKEGATYDASNASPVLEALQDFIARSSFILSITTMLPHSHDFLAWALICVLSTLSQAADEPKLKLKHSQAGREIVSFLNSRSAGQLVANILEHLTASQGTDDVQWQIVQSRLERFYVPLAEDVNARKKWQWVWERLLFTASSFNTLS